MLRQNGLPEIQPPTLLIKRFCEEHKIKESEAREYFEETKKFLWLCANNPGTSYSPSVEIDKMWHQFILHTRDYFAFCDQLGGFVHHQPAEVPTPENYELTRRDLGKNFGKLNRKYWDERLADCDSSSCDCCP